MMRRGFTIVELVVVMTIMAILLTLGIFGLQKSQANARDAERKNDIESIARGLEERYKTGNPVAYYDDGAGNTDWDKAGQYPGTKEMQHISGAVVPGFNRYSGADGVPYWESVFAGVSRASFTSPNGQTLVPDCLASCLPAGTASQYQALVDSGKYVYEPVDASGNICCCKGCVRFDLYYETEAGVLVKVTSQNQ